MKFAAGVAWLLLTWVIKVSGRPTDGDGELVLVTERRGGRATRSTESRLPSLLQTQFQLAGEAVSLRLVRNARIDTNIPFTFADKKHGKVVVPDRQDIALYQDDVQGAAISVTAKQMSNGEHHKQLEGSFSFNNSHYTIQPVDSESPELLFDQLDGVPHVIKNVQLSKVYSTTAKEHYEEIRAKFNQSQLQEGTLKHRHKRDTTIASYHVELMFVLDHTIYDYWMGKASGRNDALSKIKYYYLHIMNGIDLAYKSINTSVWGFKITPFLKEYHIAETAEESTWTETSIQTTGSTVEETVVNASAVLEKMTTWKTQEGRSWNTPDHAMLWTRYDVYGSSKGTAGYAYTAGICAGGTGVSVVEESGLYSWALAAHELGHSLGAHHDGVGNSCSASDMFLMTATLDQITTSNRANAFTFSPCTLQSFKDLLSGVTDQFPRVCLMNRVCSHGVSTEGQDILPGVTYSLDEQCAMYFGDGYTYYKYGDDTNETLCYTMHCADPPVRSVYVMNRGATFGTPCGVNKCCYKGECVSDCSYRTSTPADTCTEIGLNTDVPEGCTDSGEQFKVSGIYTTCAELITLHSAFCFTWDAARDRLCCKSCHRAGLRTQTQHYVSLVSNVTTTEAGVSTGVVETSTAPPITSTLPPTQPTTHSTQPDTTTKHEVQCYVCGSYKNDMRQECESNNFNTTVCDACWIYRQDLNGTAVTYARGCPEEDDSYKCDDFSSERCFRDGLHTLCRRCCQSDRCNDGTLTGMRDSASVTVTATNIVLVSLLSLILVMLV